MRVVVLHSSPGADPAAADFRTAAESFNRGLDIRLRFLDVGFEIREVPVRDEDEDSTERLAGTLRVFRPGIVLALGTGPRLLECAALAVKERASLAFVTDPGEDRSALAISRLAGLVLVPEAAGEPPAGPQARTFRLPAGAVTGDSLVDILVRSVREGRRT